MVLSEDCVFYIKKLEAIKAILRASPTDAIRYPELIKQKKKALLELIEIRDVCEYLLLDEPKPKDIH